MTEFYTVKRIDNSRLVRPISPRRFRECLRLAAVAVVFAGGALLYAWQHFQCIELGYRLEELKAERTQVAELSQQLRLEVAALRAPMRIDAIARRQLGLDHPVPGQVAPAAPPADAVLAQARESAAQRTQ